MIKAIREGPCTWIIVIWILMCLVITPSVQATENISGIIRIDQGQCVEPNQTVDIAGLGWYSGYIEYFGRYYDGYGVGDSNDLQALYRIKATDLKHFWLDPSYFGDKYGWWYSGYTNNESSSAGYDRLFYVAEHCNVTLEQKKEIVQEAINESQMLAAMRANITALPIKKSGYDVVISRGLTTSLEAKGGTHRWVFGTDADDGIYDIEVSPWNATTFEAQTTWNVKSGVYNVLLVSPGKNGILEEIYNAEKGVIESPFRSQQDTDIRGYDPQTVKDRLVAKIAGSYDDSIVSSWNLLLENPKIEVAKIDYRTLQNNHTMVAIAGYTNANYGDTLKIQMDVEKGVALDTHTWVAEVVNNGGMSAYRSWNSSFIFFTQDENPGPHTFTVSSDETGATATVTFYIYRELADHYQSESKLQYVGNSPFLTPPTPEIIVKEVPGPVQTVIVHDTPSPEEIRAVSDQSAWSVGSTIIIWEIIVVFLILAGLWIRSAYRRAKT